MTRTESEFRKVWLCLHKKQSCLGISENGDPDLFLNQQGNWVEAGGGGNNSWNLTGNAGTDPTKDFIGTTDKVDLVFKIGNSFAGIISSNTTSFGVASNNCTGCFNSAFGSSALNQATGSENVAVGIQAGALITTGSYNTFIGANADGLTNSVENGIAIGMDAKADSNQFAIPDSVTTIKFKGIVYTLPTSLPVVSGVLTCDSSGNLSWA